MAENNMERIHIVYDITDNVEFQVRKTEHEGRRFSFIKADQDLFEFILLKRQPIFVLFVTHDSKLTLSLGFPDLRTELLIEVKSDSPLVEDKDTLGWAVKLSDFHSHLMEFVG